jgi:hypothetical protein
MAENDAADQEHLWQIAQGEFVSQTPEHHEGDNIAGVLRPVQNAGTPLVELLAAGAAAEPAVTRGSALAPFPDGRRAAPNAFRQTGLPAAALYPFRTQLDKGRGANADGTRVSAGRTDISAY